MSKAVLVIVVLGVLGGGGFLLYQNFQTTSFKPSPEPSPLTVTTPTPTVPSGTSQVSQDACQILQNGSADVPPLYEEGITWQQPTMTEYEIPLGEGSQRMLGCLITSSKISLDLSDQVRDSYTKELQTREWELESAGDAPGAGFITWKKTNSYFVLRVNSVASDLNSKTLTLFYTK